MEIPETLQHKIDLFSSNGRVFRDGNELFGDVSWVQVMHGQGIRPNGYNPLVDMRSKAEIAEYLASIELVIQKCVDVMPKHEDYIAQHCAA
jgi:tryptophan halogenase